MDLRAVLASVSAFADNERDEQERQQANALGLLSR